MHFQGQRVTDEERSIEERANSNMRPLSHLARQIYKFNILYIPARGNGQCDMILASMKEDVDLVQALEVSKNSSLFCVSNSLYCASSLYVMLPPSILCLASLADVLLLCRCAPPICSEHAHETLPCDFLLILLNSTPSFFPH